MTHLRRSIIVLALYLGVLFNLERQFGAPRPLIDLPSFLYLLVIFMAVVSLWAPMVYRASRPVQTAGWLAIYGALKVVAQLTGERPIWGGLHSYLTVTEVALLVVGVWAVHQVARGLHEFSQAVENITLVDRVRTAAELENDIQREFVRSRRYHHPLSVIVAEPEPGSVQAMLHQMIRELQTAMIMRYVLNSLGRVISKQLRRTDLILNQMNEGRFVIISPDADTQDAAALTERLQEVAHEQLGIALNCGVASFPEAAVTFDELVTHAASKLRSAEWVTSRDQAALDSSLEAKRP